jgi:branched-chain amino acid transport system ATP-binding protein
MQDQVEMKDTPESHGGAVADRLLVARHLSRRFGGQMAVDDLNLTVRAGEVLGVIGPNGAGKSTLFNLLAGDLRPTGGEIELLGRRVERDGAEQRLRWGLGRTFQIPRPFAALSVLENVLLGAQSHPGERVLPNWCFPRRVRAEERRQRARAMELLSFMTLAPLADQPAGVLSIGQRKLLELARVLLAAPKIILLDEPMAGVQPALVETLSARIAALAAEGTTFLLVEHQLGVIATLCSRVMVMASGRRLAEGTPATVMADPRVAEAYLGMAVP